MRNRPRVRSANERVASARSYPRTARLNESLREVIAEELELLDDDRLQMVTVTGVRLLADLRQATVFYSALLGQGEVSAALGEHRIRLQAAVGRELRMKRTPLLEFAPDPAILEGDKIERLIRDNPVPERPDEADNPEGADDVDDAADADERDEAKR